MLTRLRRKVNAIRRGSEAGGTGPQRRVIYVCTRQHSYTLRQMKKPVARTGAVLEVRTFDWLLARRRIPRAAYILSDFDRIQAWYLECLGKIRDRLTAEGLLVLNDPRLWLPRPAVIRKLKQAGLSDFDCWLPALGEDPDRFPCFLRTIASHRGVASGLLHSADDANAALRAALDRGLVLSDLMFVEFKAEPVGDGYFKKHAAYRIGDHVIRGLTVNDTEWVAKHGTKGIATGADYAREKAEIKDYPLASDVRRVFETVGMEFGRIDFGFVGDRMQVYELNTNPTIQFKLDHPDQNRIRSQKIQRKQLAAAISALVPEPLPAESVRIGDLVPGKGWDRITLKQP